MDRFDVLIVIGGLMMLVPTLVGWKEDVKRWRLVAAKPDRALQFLRGEDCLIDQTPDGPSKALFTGPFAIGSHHSVFLKTLAIPRIYRGLETNLS